MRRIETAWICTLMVDLRAILSASPEPVGDIKAEIQHSRQSCHNVIRTLDANLSVPYRRSASGPQPTSSRLVYCPIRDQRQLCPFAKVHFLQRNAVSWPTERTVRALILREHLVTPTKLILIKDIDWTLLRFDLFFFRFSRRRRLLIQYARQNGSRCFRWRRRQIAAGADRDGRRQRENSPHLFHWIHPLPLSIVRRLYPREQTSSVYWLSGSS